MTQEKEKRQTGGEQQSRGELACDHVAVSATVLTSTTSRPRILISPWNRVADDLCRR